MIQHPIFNTFKWKVENATFLETEIDVFLQIIKLFKKIPLQKVCFLMHNIPETIIIDYIDAIPEIYIEYRIFQNPVNWFVPYVIYKERKVET